MAVEDKIKGLLGEQAFHIAVLLHQIDELQKRIVELQQQSPSGSEARGKNGGDVDAAQFKMT